jgi:hypothetical protein
MFTKIFSLVTILTVILSAVACTKTDVNRPTYEPVPQFSEDAPDEDKTRLNSIERQNEERLGNREDEVVTRVLTPSKLIKIGICSLAVGLQL